MSKKVLIVGGVAGGAGTAARLRRMDETAEIIVFERGGYISFANCGLPYYISGVIRKRDRLLVQTKEAMEARFNIDIRLHSEVTAILRDTREVEVNSGDQIYRESYDYLVLAPGAAPIVPPIPGIERAGIYTLRNMVDVDRLKALVTQRRTGRVVIIGGGAIGIEMAENLKLVGSDVTIVEAAAQILGPLDEDMTKLVGKTLLDNGIKIILNDGVKSFTGQENIEVVLNSGKSVEADFVILAIGVKPENKLAREAGLALGERGGIKVDDYLCTSDPYIYALGDVIEVRDIVTDQQALISLAGPANKQARIVADNIAGRKVKFKGSQGTSIIKVFDLTAASTGNNEKTLKLNGIPYVKSYTISPSHAAYYPGAIPIIVKIMFSPEGGTLYGAQIVGKVGVDKRIDVLATAIRMGLTVFDLEELELAYAPPYSSAKDPVNIAGFTAANILKGDVRVMHWDELDSLAKDSYILLDVRMDKEYQQGHVDGALHIPLDSLRERLNELPRDKQIIVHCKTGLRSYIANRILMQNGFNAANLSGGYDLYQVLQYQYGKAINMNEQMTRQEK
ncbi:Coenzyme A disulfide reductase [Sporotomaculum syntrophicum]|uniref:Coenzyme A disulfide reductase n=1 Tax=Sporotomaculum syntrophicum TaxID=182264 RepID=A0A9D2WPG0_9FIRM|nr:FAD-dependent oxidoreductase [Sporotomaculum syntrophicum]KAF1084217.1 Coenzyme A disulfide reductase [Sporotomaculum syntrophicum]